MQKTEKFNDEVLIKKFGYKKLNIKIQMIKITCFDPFFTQIKFQQLTSSLLSLVGVKGPKTSTVMRILSEQNSKKGQHEKAQQYIQRAQQIATEVLDGLQTHTKFISILNQQASIALRMKKYDEALASIEKMEALVKQIYGEGHPVFTEQFANRRFQIYAERKGQEYLAEDFLKQYGKISDKNYHAIQEGREDSCLKLISLSEQMSSYIKIARPEKVTKLYSEVN